MASLQVTAVSESNCSIRKWQQRPQVFSTVAGGTPTQYGSWRKILRAKTQIARISPIPYAQAKRI